jgi:hypothetical protein
MKKLMVIFGLTILTACSFFENKEKKAIEICQKAKVQLSTDNAFANLLLNAYGGALGLGENATWLDYANMQAKKEPNKKYDWKAEATSEKNIYLVAFVDQDKWGQRWEVDIEQQIVKFVNQNEYLSRKYGLSRFDPEGNFEITNITTDTLKLASQYDYYSENSSKEIVYVFKASVINKTGKTITDADISGKLQVIFKDKTVEGENDWDSGFKNKISKSRPWNPDTEKDFYIKTKGIETVYLDYKPEYVFFEINLKAEDPVGFSYDKNIAEYDLKYKWENLKQ